MTRDALVARITEYLTGGGLFNPEMAGHDAVRDLLIDCRAALAPAPAPAQGAERHTFACAMKAADAAANDERPDPCHGECAAQGAEPAPTRCEVCAHYQPRDPQTMESDRWAAGWCELAQENVNAKSRCPDFAPAAPSQPPIPAEQTSPKERCLCGAPATRMLSFVEGWQWVCDACYAKEAAP